MKKPICAPAHADAKVKPRRERQKKIAITTAASAKRTARYTKTETSESASFTTTKVAPQIRAARPKAKSAWRRLLKILPDMSERVYARRRAVTRRRIERVKKHQKTFWKAETAGRLTGDKENSK